MDTTSKVNSRERRIALTYVFSIFALLAGLCTYFMLSDSKGLQVLSRKEAVMHKQEQIRQFERLQAQQAPICDSLYARIQRFDPAIRAQYEEEDIKFMISDIGRMSKAGGNDSRYLIFSYTADFYLMWFYDKQEQWALQQNIRNIEKNLHDCQMGLQKKQEEIQSRKK